MFENLPKKSCSTLRAKRVTFTFWVAKRSLKIQKIITLTSFRKLDADGQSLLPDRLLLIRQKLVKRCQNGKFKNATFWVIFKHCGGGWEGTWLLETSHLKTQEWPHIRKVDDIVQCYQTRKSVVNAIKCKLDISGCQASIIYIYQMREKGVSK